MHRRDPYTGSDLIVHGLAAPPFGPGFPPTLLAEADLQECWVSDASDTEDRIEWWLWRDHAIIARMAVPGLSAGRPTAGNGAPIPCAVDEALAERSIDA